MQLFVRGLDGASLVLGGLDAHATTLGGLKAALEAATGVPRAQQLLTRLGGARLPGGDAATLAAAGLAADGALQLLLAGGLAGGKGGFGALLRGQGRDGKITDNFDACRDLSGRRIRHVEAEKKLKQWHAEAKERELEAIAMKHMKDLARAAKRERDHKINVEEVKREHKEAAERVADAVHTALAAGLQAAQQPQAGPSSRGAGSNGASSDGSHEAAATAEAGAASDEGEQQDNAAAGSSKRKAPAGAAAASPPKRRKPTMLDLVEGSSDDEGDSSSDGEASEDA